MGYCLLCDERIMETVRWSTLWLKEEETKLCVRCLEKFEPIKGEVCQLCHRPLHELKASFYKNGVCLDCQRWENDKKTAQLLTKNISCYRYNDFLKEVMKRFKFEGDAVLGTIFAKALREAYHTHFRDAVLIPIPLSEERLQERGFNQVEMLLAGWASPIDALGRRSGEKQSKKKRQERMRESETAFFLKENHLSIVKNKSIVLVDDIYTTGVTVRQAAKVLKLAGIKTVASLTVCR
ncbi:ComF family protein [Halalkalibacterium ligniniphilum]|uniref:ComF family protein n=1 Tax=Halalkalibacterium ligniniphilum TaxID=1134413 RepID=UPI00034DD643|nr:ComF family protein [Halalkalibacterium ligniniphilum]